MVALETINSYLMHVDYSCLLRMESLAIGSIHSLGLYGKKALRMWKKLVPSGFIQRMPQLDRWWWVRTVESLETIIESLLACLNSLGDL